MNADPTAAPDRSPSVTLEPAEHPPRICLAAAAGWAQIHDDTKAALEAVSAAWAGTEVHLDLGEREPDLFDLRRFVHMLGDAFDVDVVALRCRGDALRRFAERELKLELQLQGPAPGPEPEVSGPADDQAPAPPAEEPPPGAEPTDHGVEPSGVTGAAVLIVHRTLRGGSVLRHSGDIILYGDVKPGAEIIAGGSISVLGTMMGMAHAGTRSGDKGWIMAHELRPTQLRIGPRITISQPADPRGPRAPEIAYVKDGGIVIEPYRGRLPRNDSRRSDA
jgi:septum site-determining protein MinC